MLIGFTRTGKWAHLTEHVGNRALCGADLSKAALAPFTGNSLGLCGRCSDIAARIPS